MNKLSINQWDEADRPREKLASEGAATLSNAELLAILIGSGSAKESAVELMRRILADCNGSLTRLGRMEISELCAYNGIGPAKAITLMAACEVGRRRAAEPPEEKPRMSASADIYRHFRPLLEDLPREECHVMLLNTQLRLISSRCIGKGGLSTTLADIRIILRDALLGSAAAIALCHNHPGGSLRPGREDDELTSRLKQAAETMQIRLIDHIIIADSGYYSYADEGKL